MTWLANELADARELIALAEAENDTAMVTDGENTLMAPAAVPQQMRLESMLSGEADAK